MILDRFVVRRYRKSFLRRHDPDGTTFYFSCKDYEGLCQETFTFTGNKGQRLQGYIYYYGEKNKDSVVIFEHGLGNGHIGYFVEIALLAGRGFTVVAYDHTGTNASEGENIRCLAQALSDLRECVKAVSAMPELDGADISVIGHSWGGFSTMNIGAYCPEVKRVVAISGFISAHQMLNEVFIGFIKRYRKVVYKLEDEEIPELKDVSAIESLRNSDVKALIIHSKDDPVVNFKHTFAVLRRELGDIDRIEFYAMSGKGHKPNCTRDAVKYRKHYARQTRVKKRHGMLKTPEQKAEFVKSFDWKRINEQDPVVWDRIVEFLKK